MADERYIIPLPPEPEPIEKRPHPWTLRISVAAFGVAMVAATFTGWQAWETRLYRQAVSGFSFRPSIRISAAIAHDHVVLTLANNGSEAARDVKVEYHTRYAFDIGRRPAGVDSSSVEQVSEELSPGSTVQAKVVYVGPYDNREDAQDAESMRFGRTIVVDGQVVFKDVHNNVGIELFCYLYKDSAPDIVGTCK
jgi:hypothetical protein